MPHFPKPYFKASGRTWYVEVNRKQIVLAKLALGEPLPVKGRDADAH